MNYLINYKKFKINETRRLPDVDWYLIVGEEIPKYLLKKLEENFKIISYWFSNIYNMDKTITIEKIKPDNENMGGGIFYHVIIKKQPIFKIKFNDYYINILYTQRLQLESNMYDTLQYEKNDLEQINKDFFKYNIIENNFFWMDDTFKEITHKSKKYKDYTFNAIEKYTNQAIEYINSLTVNILLSIINENNEYSKQIRKKFDKYINFLLYTVQYDIYSISIINELNLYIFKQIVYFNENFTIDTINDDIFMKTITLHNIFTNKNNFLIDKCSEKNKDVILLFLSKIQIIYSDEVFMNKILASRKKTPNGYSFVYYINRLRFNVYEFINKKVI